jgi:hypothetical protein
MKRSALTTAMGAFLVLGALSIFHIEPVHADTHAPGRQTFDFTCDGVVMTFVSPNDHAKAGQALGSTSVGVAFLITYGNDVVYESPAYAGLPDGKLTTCTSGDFTFWFIIPPLQ